MAAEGNRDIIRVKRLHDRSPDTDLANTTAEERLKMMWQLTLDAWAFMGETDAESRLQRHVVRLIRGKHKRESE